MDVQGAQIAAIVIFIGMFGLIISEKVERHIVTLSAALLTLLVVFSLLMQDMGAVMKALNEACGLKTPVRGVILSLPVDDVMGLE